MDLKLKGKRALVTGPSSGLGKAIAKMLAMRVPPLSFTDATRRGLQLWQGKFETKAAERLSYLGIYPVTSVPTQLLWVL